MTFAQRSVAGEDNTRPQTYPQDLADGLIPPAPKRLKRKTIEAVERATRIGGLGRSARAALAALARTANNDDPNGRIFKHRETLCSETDMSPATWYRAQKELLALGLITVDVQVRKRFGRFAGAYIYLTEKATLLLGLTHAHTHNEFQENIRGADAGTTGEQPATESTSLEQPSLKTTVLFTEDRLPYAFQKRQQDRLPTDLKRLRTLGLDESLIFWLMKKAKDNGHFLSQVVEATWKSLSTARSPKAYLLGLLSKKTDFAAICARNATKQQVQIRQASEQQFMQSTLAPAARKQYVDNTGHLFEIESDAKSVLVRDPTGRTSRLVGANLMEFARRLSRGDFQQATAALPTATVTAEPGERMSNRAAASLGALKMLMGIAGKNTMPSDQGKTVHSLRERSICASQATP